MSKNVKQLKELLIKQLREHQLDFNLEGEGDNEVIILSRQALVLAGSNEEFSSLIVKCMQANVKMNLLGSANEVINARITRPVFNERTVTVADQQEDLFDIPEPSNIGLIKGEALLESFDASHYDNKDPLRYIMEYSQSKSNLNSEQTQILLSEFYKEHMQHFGAHPSERPIVITNIMIKDKQVYKEFLEDKINKYNMGNLWYSLFDDIQNYYCNKCELSTIMENAKMLGLNYSVMNRDGKFYCDFGREDLILFAMELKGVDKQKYMKQQKVLSEFCRGKDLVNKPVMETGLKESLRNPSLDYKEELKKQLFEALDKNELDYKVSGEGKRQIITIPRATLVQIKDNEEICSIIIDCYKANVKLNLLGAFECPSTLRDKLNTLEVADTTYYANIDNAEKLIFNKPNHKSKEYLDLEKLLINHVTNLLNDKDISFSVEDIINSSYVVVPQFSKSLIQEIVSSIMKDNKSFIARRGDLTQSDMDKIILGGSAFLAGGCLIDDEERKMFSDKNISDSAVNFFIKHVTPESVKVGTNLTEKERDNILSDTIKQAREEISLRNSDKKLKAKNNLIKFLNENNYSFKIKTDSSSEQQILMIPKVTLNKFNFNDKALILLSEYINNGGKLLPISDYDLSYNKLNKMNTRKISDEPKNKESELRQELKGEINNGDLVNRFGQEIADLIVEARIAEENGNKEHYFKCFEDAIDILNYRTTKEEAQNAVDSLEVELTEEFYKEVYNVLLPIDLHDKTLSSLKVIVEHSGIEIKYDSALVEAILRVLTSDLDLDETITLDRVKILLLQDYTLNETIEILENRGMERYPSEHQYSNLSADDYCRVFLNLYEKKGNLKDQEVYKFLLENGYNIKRVRQELGLNPSADLPVFEILNKLDVFRYSNYELVLYCYFLIGNHAMDSVDTLVNTYCESKGKIDGSFFNTSVVNSRINEIVALAYKEVKSSYNDLLRIYLKRESIEKYNEELKAYNEVQERVEQENDIVRKEELIKESKEIMSLANTYKFSETSITNIQVSRLEMEMSDKIYKMVGKDLYFKYFDFISLSCTAGARRIVYMADKENAKYGTNTITEEISKSVSLNNELVEPNRTIVTGMDYNYMLTLTAEYRHKLVRRILRKDMFFGFATAIIDSSKIKDYFEISCRKKETNGILIDTILAHYNGELFMFRDGEFVLLKGINYETFSLIADLVNYGVIGCLDTKAYDKIIGFYKRNNYSQDTMNKVVNLEKFVNTVYEGFTVNENTMQLVLRKNGTEMIKAINSINYKAGKVVYII